ncbi:MAG: hypothetical protein ACREMY_32880 [bacterium]
MTADAAILPHESEADFEELRAAFLARFEPLDVAELALVEQMIIATWRQRRYWSVESRLLSLEIEDNRKRTNEQWNRLNDEGHCALAFQSLGYEGTLDRLLRYDNSLRRQFERAMNTLLKLRLAERTARNAALSRRAVRWQR